VRWSLRPETFARVVSVALLALVAIIYTGSLVRLSGSGLGCDDWPACNETRFVDVSTGHAAVEQVNRLFTGVVAASVIAAVLSALLVRPAIARARLLALGLVVGVAAQVVIGGIVVLTGLNPWSNMVHFLVSVVLVTNAVVLHERARAVETTTTYSLGTRRIVALLAATLTVTVVLGTIVTATGPHAGDAAAPRFDLDLGSVVRLHSVAALVSTGALLTLVWRLRRHRSEWAGASRRVEALLFWLVAQVFVGYLQYFSGVPVPLVFVHIVVSIIIWVHVVRLVMLVHASSDLRAAVDA
jgi:cytochrome c oxidase assembly protein subunit 15